MDGTIDPMARITARKGMPLPDGLVDKLMQRLQSAVSTYWGGNNTPLKTASLLVALQLTQGSVTTVDGRPITDIQVHLQAANVRSTKVVYGGYTYTDGSSAHIVLSIAGGFTADRAKQAFCDSTEQFAIQRILVHELTHVLDVDDPDSGINPAADPKAYINSPSELKAYGNEVWHHIVGNAFWYAEDEPRILQKGESALWEILAEVLSPEVMHLIKEHLGPEGRRYLLQVAYRALREVWSSAEASDSPKASSITAAALPDLGSMVSEFSTFLDPEHLYPTPEAAYVNRSSAAWLGHCAPARYLKDKDGVITGILSIIHIQKGLAVNPDLLRSVVAHEVAHSISDNEAMVGHSSSEDLVSLREGAVGKDGHGPLWQEVADRLNATYGDGFVTKTSDMLTQEWETKEVFLLAVTGRDLEIPVFCWVNKVPESAVAKMRDCAAAGQTPYIVKTRDRFLVHPTFKGPAFFASHNPHVLEALNRDLQGPNLFEHYASRKTAGGTVTKGDLQPLDRSAYDAAISALVPLPHEVFYVGDGIEVIRNPTDRDYQAMAAEVKHAYPLMLPGDPKLRSTHDTRGNIWIWQAHKGMHGNLEPLIALHERMDDEDLDQTHEIPTYREVLRGAPLPSVKSALFQRKPIELNGRSQ